LPAAALLLLGMVISAFTLRGTKRRYNWPATIGNLTLFVLQSALAGLATLIQANNATDAPSMFEITLFGIFAFGILVCLAATWLRPWRFTESVGVGLVAVALGALCLPGLRLLTQQVSPPYQTGSALLFASGQPDQGLKLLVSVTGVHEASQSEEFDVSNLSKHPIRWALLTVGGARIHRYWGVSDGVRVKNFSAAGPNLNTPAITARSQIFYGSLGAGATAYISGTSAENFADSTSDETGVTLPNYDEGFVSFLSPATKTAVINALGEQPAVRRRTLFITRIVASPIFPDDSVASPDQTPSAAPPDGLEWKGSGYPINFTITNQQAAGAVSNFMFAFAILLGVAGAGVMASLQGAIHASAVPPKLDSSDHE
jgi:hypothetical protein